MASDETVAVAKTAKSIAPDPLIGRIIANRFKVTGLIARGGMGKVYKAEQAPFGRICAVKVLNPNYNGDADPEFHRRFFREAKISSQITHPNSITIFDYGKTDDDIYYMVMEYLEGQTLHQVIRSVKTMPEERVAWITQQICRAVREAHALGVVHRDLKPANIFMSRHGDDEDFVKVLDFGLVKHLVERPEDQLTQTGLFMGSPKYMAPEQIQGAQVDARTDVYSLGIMMYEMLTGKVPFERSTSVNILMAHVGEPPPAMRETNPNIACSSMFEDLVMRCIAKDPRERFTSMDDLLLAIKAAHGGLISMSGHFVSNSIAPAASRSSLPARSGSESPSSRHRVSAQRTSSVPPSGGPSGSHTSMGMLRSQGLREKAAGAGAWRSAHSVWLWGAAGAGVAILVGSSVGAMAFRWSGRHEPLNTAAADTQAAEGAPPSPAVAPLSSSQRSFDPRPAPAAKPPGPTRAEPSGVVGMAVASSALSVALTTEPAGAIVREDSNELCAATPCQITLRSRSSEATSHSLLFSHPGFRSESRTVKPGDTSLHVRLTRLSGAAGRFITSPSPSPRAPSEARPVAEPAPPGFKDLPY